MINEIVNLIHQKIEIDSPFIISFLTENLKSELNFFPVEVRIDKLGLYVEDKDGFYFWIQDVYNLKTSCYADGCYRLTHPESEYAYEISF